MLHRWSEEEEADDPHHDDDAHDWLVPEPRGDGVIFYFFRLAVQGYGPLHGPFTTKADATRAYHKALDTIAEQLPQFREDIGDSLDEVSEQ